MISDIEEGAEEAHETTPRYTVAAVARRLGVPTATLRSWTHRYRVGPIERTPGSHRLYSEHDIAVVQYMHTLIMQGASPPSAARTAMDSVVPTEPETVPLLQAAFDFDVFIAEQILKRHALHWGVVDTWERLIRPVFAAIVRHQLAGQQCVDVEHMLSWAVSRCFQQMPLASNPPIGFVILACTDGEAHSLPLEALRAAMYERNHGAVMLGAAVPQPALLDALTRRSDRPTVVLWSQMAATADVPTLESALDEKARVIAAGPGWDSVCLPDDALRTSSLQDAIEKTVAVC